ncbi:MAG: metallophosphoesterase [Limnohabitans sp.]|nr:metallophosphoesterase [Limnohabitans sp.]
MPVFHTLLAVSALLLPTTPAHTHTPPAFEKDSAGQAIDGQRVTQAPRPRRQVVAIVPDRTTGKDWGLRYLREAVDDFNRAEPDAVFCVGDLVQGYSRDRTEVLRQRNDFLNIVGALTMPFYPTPGNHDVVSGTREAKDRTFATEYRELFGPLYYSVELDLASFVILNTEDGEGEVQPGFSDAQLAWLDTELARLAQRARPIILLFHRPLWDHKPTRWDERVQPLLVKHRVASVIAGHYHALQILPARDGIPFMLLGTCGGANDQHPLAGHLQHITYLVIDESGRISPYHQVAGCTMPADWITKDDQDRAYQLKGSRDAVRITGAVPDPVGRPITGAVQLTLKNPLDREVEFRVVPSEAPKPWTVRDNPTDDTYERVWTSRTPIDLFNAATTDLDSPFRLKLPSESVRLAPGDTQTITIDVTCDTQITPPEPAPFEVIATYRDARNRRVPIVFRQRVPIARSIELAGSIASALPYPIAVWNWSEYDTTEANATARMALGDGDSLLVEIVAPDAGFSPFARTPKGRKGMEDPLGDAVRVVLGEGPEAREYFIAFDESESPWVRTLAASGNELRETDQVQAVLSRANSDSNSSPNPESRKDGSWTLRLNFLDKALPEGRSADGLPVNIGVADNDETYHTQWRWLAPRSLPATLRKKP